MQATHVRIGVRHDLHQCVTFDSDAADARLIEIESNIGEDRFADILAPRVVQGANSWTSGKSVQTRLGQVDVKR